MPWPTDIAMWLSDADVAVDFDVDAAVNAAVDELESRTGRVPFLPIASGDKTFDPPDGRSGVAFLDLQGYRSISAIVWDGATLTAGTDYVLIYGPEVRVGSGLERPIDAVRFLVYQTSEPGSITITGVRGSYSDAPSALAIAVAQRAAATAIESAVSASGAVRKRTIGERSIEYAASQADGAVSNLATTYRKAFADALAPYVRIPRG